VSQKISRNAPCPCGSGRKYKRCCHDQDRIRTSRRAAEGTFRVGPVSAPASARPYLAAAGQGFRESEETLQAGIGELGHLVANRPSLEACRFDSFRFNQLVSEPLDAVDAELEELGVHWLDTLEDGDPAWLRLYDRVEAQLVDRAWGLRAAQCLADAFADPGFDDAEKLTLAFGLTAAVAAMPGRGKRLQNLAAQLIFAEQLFEHLDELDDARDHLRSLARRLSGRPDDGDLELLDDPVLLGRLTGDPALSEDAAAVQRHLGQGLDLLERGVDLPPLLKPDEWLTVVVRGIHLAKSAAGSEETDELAISRSLQPVASAVAARARREAASMQGPAGLRLRKVALALSVQPRAVVRLALLRALELPWRWDDEEAVITELLDLLTGDDGPSPDAQPILATYRDALRALGEEDAAANIDALRALNDDPPQDSTDAEPPTPVS